MPRIKTMNHGGWFVVPASAGEECGQTDTPDIRRPDRLKAGLRTIRIRENSNPKWAFTLIELLVVIAIMALLASLLAPALRAAKIRIKSVACMNNLKQWGAATALYAFENDDELPPEGVPNPTPRSTNSGWYVQLPRQLNLPPYHEMPWRTNAAIALGRSVWICPDNPRRSNGRNLFHYCLNEHVNGTGREARSVKLSSIDKPSAVPWLFDSKNLPAVGYWGFVHTNLHNQSAQFLFLDGHVHRFPNSDYWDFGTDRGRTNNPDLLWIR